MKYSGYNFFFWGLFMMVLCSCQDKVIVSYYETGEKQEEYQYSSDSVKHGLYKRYSPEGTLIETANYVHNKLEGERIIYNFKSGVKEISEYYNDDLLDGNYIEFHPNGEIKSLGVYTDNLLSGTVRLFKTSGVLIQELQYLNNYEVIPFKEYHENGKIKWEGTKRYDHYFKTKKDYRLLLEYNEQGELIRKISCDEKEICTTIWSIDQPHLK